MGRKIREVDINEYLPILQDIIKTGKDVTLLVSGSSMSPFLIHHRDTIIISKPMQPLKRGFNKVKKALKEDSRIAVVGDQIFTDIIGGNRSKMFTILVEPINEKEYWYTAWKRPIENRIKRKIQKEK